MTYRDINNIGIVPQPYRDQIKGLMHHADTIFAHNDMAGGFIHSFLYDTVSGQIIRSLKPKEAKGQYHNSLNDFYIDSRVSFKGRKELQSVIDDLHYIFMQITKFTPQKFHVGDWVRINKITSNVSLKKHIGKKAKIVKLTKRSISSPGYEGFYVRIEGKGSHIYAGSNDVKKAGKGWQEQKDPRLGKAKRHSDVQTMRRTKDCLTKPITG